MAQDALRASGDWNMSGAGRFIFYMASITTGGQPGVIESHTQIPRHHTLVATITIQTSWNGWMRWSFARDASDYTTMTTLTSLRRHLAVIECRGRRPPRGRRNIMAKIALRTGGHGNMFGRIYRKIDLVTGITTRRYSRVVKHHAHIPCRRALVAKITIGSNRRSNMSRCFTIWTIKRAGVASIATHRRHGRM